ncbi:MAG: M24 family metallopeptidase, partial [Verrucomicrobiales bacterium]|nr:M24 family metallopeptidase [Verrucomicrobiales bacterium]
MKYDPIDASLFAENRKRVLAELPTDAFAVFHSADIPWRSADGSMRFIQNSDLFYLTGVDQEDTMLILDPGADDPEKRELLFVRETSEEIAIWEGEKLSREQAVDVSGGASVKWNDRFLTTFRRLMRRKKRVFLNHNEYPRLGVPIFYTPDDRFRKECQQEYPNHQFERLGPIMHRLRQVKSQVEIDLLQHACDITGKGFRRVLKFIRPGVKEYEVEAELLHEFMMHGARGFAYE